MRSKPAFAMTSGPSLVFVNGMCSGTLDHLYNTDLVGGSWLASHDIAPNPSIAANLRPAITAPTSGPELVVAYVQASPSQQILAAYRTNGAWSAPVAITSGLTTDPVALAPLAGGGVLLAYRGTDSKLYTAQFSGGAWSTAEPAFSPNVTISAAPSLAKGVGTAAAEMAYVDANGALWHARFNGVNWAAPLQVAGSGFAHVAIASAP